MSIFEIPLFFLGSCSIADYSVGSVDIEWDLNTQSESRQIEPPTATKLSPSTLGFETVQARNLETSRRRPKMNDFLIPTFLADQQILTVENRFYNIEPMAWTTDTSQDTTYIY